VVPVAAAKRGSAEFGGAPLREAIAAGYERVAPNDVAATCGGDDSLPSLFIALLQPGDHAVVPTPAYQPLAAMAAWCGGHRQFLGCGGSGEFSPGVG
jgi:aspartate/methionine/tyrosine aminotransferase